VWYAAILATVLELLLM